MALPAVPLERESLTCGDATGILSILSLLTGSRERPLTSEGDPC
jgi:hypothetical protein